MSPMMRAAAYSPLTPTSDECRRHASGTERVNHLTLRTTDDVLDDVNASERGILTRTTTRPDFDPGAQKPEPMRYETLRHVTEMITVSSCASAYAWLAATATKRIDRHTGFCVNHAMTAGPGGTS